MSEQHLITTWKTIPSSQASLRAMTLLEVIAKAEERLKRRGRTWSVDQESKVDEKERAAGSAH